MRKILLICGVLLIGLAAACTLAPRETGSLFMFALGPADITRQDAGKEILIVDLPTTAPELDTFRIALKRGKSSWDYYAGAKWPDFLPVVVQDDMTKTLEHTGLFKTVATDETGLVGDRMLKMQIEAFQAEYAGGAPVIKIRIAATLVSRLEEKSLASFTVAAEKESSGNTLSAIQAAFAAAFSDAQKQLAAKLEAAIK